MVERPEGMNKSRWNKWSGQSQSMFRDMYEFIDANQTIFSHPKMIEMPKEYWNTIAWNAAYMAAEFVRLHAKEQNGKEEEAGRSTPSGEDTNAHQEQPD